MAAPIIINVLGAGVCPDDATFIPNLRFYVLLCRTTVMAVTVITLLITYFWVLPRNQPS
jgi:hypothetical protein